MLKNIQLETHFHTTNKEIDLLTDTQLDTHVTPQIDLLDFI